MTIRTRRLTRDYEKILTELTGSEFVNIKATGGDPPNSYQVTYHLNGLMWDQTAGDTKPISEHIVDIYLPIGYPKRQPNCTMRTPIWHPNIGDYICIGDYWSAGVTLVDIIAHIGDMIQYKTYNLHSPVNKTAAAWAQGRVHSFPIGTRDILPPENGNGSKPDSPTLQISSDMEIELGPVRERRG